MFLCFLWEECCRLVPIFVRTGCWHVSEFWSANENVEHFEGVCVAFEINRGAYYTFMRWCSTEWALHIYCLQFPFFDRFGKWESVRVCLSKEFQVFPKSDDCIAKRNLIFERQLLKNKELQSRLWFSTVRTFNYVFMSK